MNTEMIIPLGKHKGKTMGTVMHEDPCYILWLAGTRPRQRVTAAFLHFKVKHPETVNNAKLLISNRCHRCWAMKEGKHLCSMSSEKIYHFRSYGKQILDDSFT